MKFHQTKFTACAPVPDESIENVVTLMQQGTLYRYGQGGGDQEDGTLLESEVSRLEDEFSQCIGFKYTVAVNSCGSAMFLALKAAGVQPGDKVFTNAFTFTAVPSSIIHAGARPVYVECNRQYTIDVEDLAQKIEGHPDVKYCLLSHMRGHISDLDKVKELCDRANIVLIEDCAHSLGAQWYNKTTESYQHVGQHGVIACFSTQSYKLLNSGEGGFISTNDEEMAAYCALAAGAYEKYYRKHKSVPADDQLFERLKFNIPNYSMRMSNLTAAVLRPQLQFLSEKVADYNARYDQLVGILSHVTHIEIPEILPQVRRVGSSMQFNLLGLTVAESQKIVKRLSEECIKVQIFGHADNSRNFRNWRYSFDDVPDLKQTEAIIATACDIRLPLSLNAEDINLLGYLIKDALYKVLRREERVDYKTGLTDVFTDVEEIESKYESWAHDYDKEHEENGWKILLNDVAYTLKSRLTGDADILDIGCGTGLLGAELHSFGLNNLSGIDLSETSLDISRNLNIYKTLQLEELGKAIDFADNSFDALVSSGVFTRKQVPLNAFDELLRILKPGGMLAVVLRVEDDGYYDDKLKEYISQQVLTEVMRQHLSVLKSCSHDLVVLKSLKS